jgi:hypothetical protein
MTDTVSFDGIGERLDNMVLSNDGIPSFGAVLTVEGLSHL